MSEKNTEQSDNKRLYEVGFHLVPSLNEEEVQKGFTHVTEAIAKNEGVLKTSHNPEMRPLAYPIIKKASGKKNTFTEAYFGYVVFEIEKENIGVFRGEIEKIPGMLRLLLVEISPEALLPRERRIPQTHREEPKCGSDAKVNPALPQMTEEELDKTIEQLVVE